MVVATIPSTSNPNVTYQIQQGKDGKTYCSCPAWRFSKDRDCKHLKALRLAVVR
jgi:predicted nucleic acid-binding Zn finger protein